MAPKRLDRIGPSVWQSIYVSIAGGLLFLLLIPAAGTLFHLVGHSQAMQKLEAEYSVALCYSGMPTALVAAASGFFTGLGNTQIIMRINVVGLIANAVSTMC